MTDQHLVKHYNYILEWVPEKHFNYLMEIPIEKDLNTKIPKTFDFYDKRA